MESLSYNLCFAWQGDYDSLKKFVRDELKLDGVWEQPGGDKKIFSTADISISWRKNKNLLHIVGDELGKYTKLLCSKIYEDICLQTTSTDGSSQTEPAILQSTIGKDNDVYSHIDDLRSGQELNRFAIQSLSHSVEHLTEIISQFRKEIDKVNINQPYKVDKNPVCSQDTVIEIPQAPECEVIEAFNDPSEGGESIQALGNESLITLESSKTTSDVNGDGSGLLTGPINYSSEAEELILTSGNESLITPESSKTKSDVKGDGSILLIGDSIIKNIHPRKLSRRKVNKRTFPGKTAEEIISEVKNIKSDPSHIILHAGTNNLPVNNPSVCIKKIESLAININKKFPNSTIGLSSITLRRDLNLEEQVAKVNEGLQEFCTKNEFNFIDNRNLDSSCLNGSLLHLNAKGSAYLAANFIKFLRGNTSFASTTSPKKRRNQDFPNKTARLSFLEDILSMMLSPQRPINRSRRS